MRYYIIVFEEYFIYAFGYLCIDDGIFLKYGFIYFMFNVLYLWKILKVYYGFRVLYVFPFPSAGHGPIGSGRDKVGIRAYVLLII